MKIKWTDIGDVVFVGGIMLISGVCFFTVWTYIKSVFE